MTLRETIRWHYKNTPWFRSAMRRTKDTALYAAVRLALGLVHLMPFAMAMWVAERIAGVVFRVMPSLGELSARNMAIALPGTTPEERRRIAREATISAARILIEIAKFDDIRPRIDDYVEVIRPEVAEVLRHSKSGAIVVTGHYDNWELLAAYFALKGIDIAAVARRVYVEKLHQIMVDFRSSNGIETIVRDETSRSARQMLSVLKRGGVLAMVVDQDTHAQSLSVPFFGRNARTPLAPVALAIKRRLPLIQAYIERLPDGRHRITLEPPCEFEQTGDPLGDYRAGLIQLNRRLEEQIRRRPEQWMWWHKRWDRAPIPQLDLDAEFQYTDPRSASPPETTETTDAEARGRSART